jgi:hypothetical protein
MTSIGRHVLLAGAALLLACLPQGAGAGAPTKGVGLNIYALTSASTQIPFIDVFKMSSPWIVRLGSDPRYKGVPKLTKDGWIASLEPGEYGFTQILNNGAGQMPAGTYTVLYRGKGTLDFHWRGVEVAGSEPGRVQLTVTPQLAVNGIAVKIMATDPQDPIRDIKVILPGFEQRSRTEEFYPPFLDLLRPFKLLRMMAWNRTNRADSVEWADRRPPDYATQASDLGNAQQPMTGVAYEYQIDLANQLGADPWVNVPVKASDDFIRHMAELFHQRLKPELHPHIEFSNEVWNTYFSEGKYAQAQGMAAGLAGDAKTAGLYWYVQRAERMYAIWDEVYGADAAKLVRIMGGVYEGDPKMAETVLSYAAVPHHEDALAVGAYFASDKLNYKLDPGISSLGPDQIFPLLEAEVKGRVRNWLTLHEAAARNHKLPLVIYEGGPSLDTTGVPDAAVRQTLTTTYTAVNRDPRMAALYRELLDEFFDLGGTLFVHFNDVFQPASFGNWGLLEYQDQDPNSSPKFVMLRDYIKANAARFGR